MSNKSVKLIVSNILIFDDVNSLQCVVFKVLANSFEFVDNLKLRSEFVTPQTDSKNFVFLITDILRISFKNAFTSAYEQAQRSVTIIFCLLLNYQMEIRRFELLTPCLQGRCSPN